jgi:hypothetical protein
MAGIEIHEYDGDFEDLTELTRRAWTTEYAGKAWFSLPEAPALRHMARNGTCLAAYHGGEVVGSMFSIPYSIRVGPSTLPTAFITGLTVDPAHRRVALPLIERIRRLHTEQGIDFAIGGVANDPTSGSYRFWTKYGQTFPGNLHYLFSTGHWVKILEPRAVARAGVKQWERLTARVLGRLLSFTPPSYDRHVRPGRGGDLERCTELLNQGSRHLEWAVVWSPAALAGEFGNPAAESLVFDQGGSVQAVVQYRRLVAYGRSPLNAALIELWATEGLSASQRVRLLGHVCNRLREREVHIVLVLGCGLAPTSALAANLFLPPVPQLNVFALSTGRGPVPAPPKSWNLVLA